MIQNQKINNTISTVKHVFTTVSIMIHSKNLDNNQLNGFLLQIGL